MFHSVSPQADFLISKQEAGKGWRHDVQPSACKLTSSGKNLGTWMSLSQRLTDSALIWHLAMSDEVLWPEQWFGLACSTATIV